MDNLPCYGLNRQRLDRIFRDVGGRITIPSGTGEIRYWHPLIGRYATANMRRKDAPRALVAYVREVIRLRKGKIEHGAPR